MIAVEDNLVNILASKPNPQLLLHQHRLLTEIEEEINSYMPAMMSSSYVSGLSQKLNLRESMQQKYEMQRYTENLRLSSIRMEVESRMTVSDRVQLLGSIQCNNESHD